MIKDMNLYAIPPFITYILITIIAIFVLKRNIKSQINVLFSLFCLSLVIWLFGFTNMYLSKDKNVAFFWARVGFTSIIFIPILAYHFMIALLGRKQKKFITFLYFAAIPSIYLGWTDYVYKGLGSYFWGYYPIAGKLYFIFLSSFLFLFSLGLFYLFWGILESKKRKEMLLCQQLKYVFAAFLFGTTGLIDYVIKYKIEIYPFGYISALIFISVIAYAIVRYHLMDIKIAITRFGIFVFVYSLVLGVPFFIGHLYPDRWFLAVSIMAVLATGGPYIYLYLQKRAEEKLLEEQKRYQHTLRQASLGMGRIKDLNRLLELMVHILSKTVRMTHCEIYLVDKEAGNYELKASRGLGDAKVKVISSDSPLIKYLKHSNTPLVAEEFKHKAVNFPKDGLTDVKGMLSQMNSVLVIPSFVQDQLLSFIAFGEKKSHEAYSADDLIIFSILASQAALAIENCIYWEAERTRMKEAGLQQRLISLDAMASSFAHEVDNPVQGCSLALEFIKQEANDINNADQRIKENIINSVGRVTENLERISRMVGSMLDFSRKSSGELLPLSIYDVINGFTELVYPKMKTENVKFNVDKEENLPSILGDKIQLEEIFVNFSLNSIHAVAKNEKNKRFINFKVFRRNDHLRVEFSDNGYGIKKNKLEDIFLASVTTKASTEGTGLGLYRVRKIIELHNGKVWAESEGEGKGATFIIELPLYFGENKAKDSRSNILF